MARIEKLFASGTIAGVIFYEHNGRPCARSKPAHVRQTAATQRAGKRFGSGKTISKLLRQSLGGLLPHYSNKPVMYRVDKGVMPWMRAVQGAGAETIGLPGFSCAGEEDYGELLQLQITAAISGNSLQVTIPGSSGVGMPAGSNRAVLYLSASCISPNKNEVLRSEEQHLEISLPPGAGDATVLQFDIVQEEGVFIVLTAALRHLRPGQGTEAMLAKPGLQAVGVLQGWYCGMNIDLSVVFIKL